MFKFLLFSLLLIPSFCSADEIPIKKVPHWVLAKQVKLDAEIPKDEVKNGRYYLLVDKQTKVDKHNEVFRFRHYATHAINPEGVETESQINIEYDPNYQTLALHKITVWRNGLPIDKTHTSKKSLLNQEKNLERLIYDGTTTLNILLSDIRTGDIIEYSYSIRGSNPVFEGVFSLSHSLNWSVPLEQSYIRILWGKQQELQHKIFNSSSKIKKQVEPGGIEFVISENNIEALKIEDNIPEWKEPYAYVQFSEVASWKDVVDWGIPLFGDKQRSNSLIKKTIDHIIGNEDSIKNQIALVLNFVQTEVRYLGIEFGENSHRPSLASETLGRLYGDCKDKVVLFNTLLKEIGVNAVPALVNTYSGKDLDNRIPRYSAFNHVITAIEIDDRIYWLDPTRLNQTKSLDDIHQPDFGYALLLNDRHSTLTNMNPIQKQSKIEVNETFRLFDEPNLSAEYNVSTNYYHLEAEKMRREQIDKSNSDIRKGYLKYYKDYYPTLKASSKAVFKDNKESNLFSIEENYLIDTFWTKNEEEKNLYGNFYANLISPFLTLPKDLERKFPYQVAHPTVRKQVTNVYFEGDNWDFTNEEYESSTLFFDYRESTEFSKAEKKLTLSYYFESKLDLIEPDQYIDYLKALKELKNQTEFGIYIKMKKNQDDLESLNDDAEASYILYLWFFAGYLVLALITIVWWRMDSSRNQFNDEMVYYPVNPIKFLVFWIATLGLYAMYWHYKNWKYIKTRDSLQIMPFARGFFYTFWYYPLYKVLLNENETLTIKGNLPSKWIAILVSILFASIILLGNFLRYEIIALIISSLLVLPLLSFINFINRGSPQVIQNNSKWRIRHILVIILFCPIVIFTLGTEIGLLPSDSVVKGSTLSGRELTFLQRKNVISPNESILYFYSGDSISNLDDGNGFTRNQVFSYWLEGEKFVSDKANFKDIMDIEVTWAKSKITDDTIVKIIKNDNSHFLLFISAVDRKDKLFVNELKRLWNDQTK